MPEVTVGMPVHNGAATIGAALDSLLGQTFRDFRIVVCDNGSSDATGRICDAYVRGDPRISYVRLEAHVDATQSFRQALLAASTPYFMWAAADDLWAPRFIEAHHAFLREHPDYVGSQSRVLFVSGGFPSRMALGTFALTGEAGANAARFFARPADNSRFYGLFRTEVLKAVYPTRDLYGYDWVVSAGTLKFGRHHEVDEILAIRDETDPAAYAEAAARHLGGRLRGLFPVLPASWYVVRNRLVPFSPALAVALVRTNLRLPFRFLMYRLHRRLRASLGRGGAASAVRAIGAVARPGLRERVSLLGRVRARAARGGCPARIEVPERGWPRLDRPEQPHLSVVAVVRDQLLDLLGLTHRLRAACGRCAFELIVADLGSNDATGLCLGKRDDLVYLACKGGLAAAAEAAVAAARGSHLVFVDAGVAPHVGAFAALADALSRAGMAGAVGVGGRGVGREASAEDFRSGAFALGRASWEAAGGFDPAYRTLQVAGADLAVRLRKAGARAIVEQGAVVSLDAAGAARRRGHGADLQRDWEAFVRANPEAGRSNAVAPGGAQGAISPA